MTAAVLAVQGAFAEHEQKLDELGINHIELRARADLDRDFDALILPGGESTVQGKLLRELGMFDALKDRIQHGLPVLATCAGMILLAESIENDDRQYFATLPVTVRRNAYGRQLGSFFTEAEYDGLGKVPQTYIRAPFVTNVSDGVEVLSEVDGHITAVRYKNQTALAFHPELSGDLRIYRDFLRQGQDTSQFHL